MNGYTHMVVGGLTAGLALSASISVKQLGFDINAHTVYPVLFVMPAIIGGLGPDIDMPNSTSGRFIRKALFLSISGSGLILFALAIITLINGGVFNTLIPLAIFFVIVCGLIAFVSTAKHRRETHSGLLCLLLFLPVIWIVLWLKANLLTNTMLSIWIGFWLGWFSHLVADSFNRKGVPWLYPLKNAKGKYTYYHIMTVTTGTEQETIFRVCSYVVMMLFYFVIILLGRLFV